MVASITKIENRRRYKSGESLTTQHKDMLT